MWPIVLIVVYFVTIGNIVLAGVEDMREVIAKLQNEARAEAVDEIARAALDFSAINARFPADLDELINTATFEYTRTHQIPGVAYRRADALVDGPFTFQRAAAVYLGRDNFRNGMDANAFFSPANNQCTNNAFTDSQSWCGLDGSYWWRAETRWRTAESLEFERMALTRTLQKFAIIFAASNPYQFPGAASGMAPGDTQPLHVLVGAPATSAACTAAGAVYDAWGHVFDCSDLFADSSGDSVFYTYVEPTYIALSTRTPYRNQAGGRIVVSQEMIAE